LVDEKASPRTIRVVDRRRFTVEGDPRLDAPREAGPAREIDPPPVSEPDRARRDAAAAPADRPSVPPAGTGTVPPPQVNQTPATSPVFVELVATLAQQAELLLVGAEGLPAEPEQARRLIDYLAALESKTAGNLSPEETEILSSVVFQLRTLFVQRR
jgi:hypothetical protein